MSEPTPPTNSVTFRSHPYLYAVIRLGFKHGTILLYSLLRYKSGYSPGLNALEYPIIRSLLQFENTQWT